MERSLINVPDLKALPAPRCRRHRETPQDHPLPDRSQGSSRTIPRDPATGRTIRTTKLLKHALYALRLQMIAVIDYDTLKRKVAALRGTLASARLKRCGRFLVGIIIDTSTCTDTLRLWRRNCAKPSTVSKIADRHGVRIIVRFSGMTMSPLRRNRSRVPLLTVVSIGKRLRPPHCAPAWGHPRRFR